jgi:TIR domain/Protein kinase domain
VVFDTEENVYLTDFAIAQRVSSGAGKPVMGTAAYMAPEQWKTEGVTTAIDQFALAALAYYMTTGSRPFEGQDHPEVRKQNFRRGPMPAHEEAARNGRELAPGVSRVLGKALAMSPADRYPSVAEFGKAFVAAVSGRRSAGGVPQVFLSYQREGASGWASYFSRELKDKHGVSVFVDVERRDGAGRFPARLERAIQECDVFVVILGASTLDSKWVREEIKLAYEHQRPMVPVFQESWTGPDVPRGSDPALEALISYDGVHLLDRRNIHVDHTIADLARLVKDTVTGRTE